MAEVSMHVFDNVIDVKTAIEDQIQIALESIGLIAESEAKVNITDNHSVDTGNLRNSITHQVDMDEHSVTIGSAVEYAPYVECGTGIYYPGGRQTPWSYQKDGKWYRTNGQQAKPFLKPAMVDNMETFKQIIKDSLAE